MAKPKYEIPKLIDISGKYMVSSAYCIAGDGYGSAGLCSLGSSFIGCMSGSGEQDSCSTGSSALGWCSDGGSASAGM